MPGARVSSNLFDLLRVRQVAGRVFAREEDQSGGNRVAVISEGLWQRRFGGSTDALGKALTLDGEAYEIIGVLPAQVTFPGRPDVWIPIAFSPEELSNQRHGAHGIGIVGRLKPGVTFEKAQEGMGAIAARLGTQYPASNKGWGITLVSMMDSVVGSGVRRALWVLLGAVAVVLLIACVNIAGLLLAQSAARSREAAIRSALGAGRLRLTRQFLVESAAAVRDAPLDFLTNSKSSSLQIIARLKPGVTLNQTQPVLHVAAQGLSEPNHGEMTVRALRLSPASLATGPAVRPQLSLISSLLLILAGAVLLLACMNIANLCLVHVAVRYREFAMRAALGAARSRLIRQLLTESLLLAILGCVAGILIGIGASRSFQSISLHTAISTVPDFGFPQPSVFLMDRCAK